MSATDRVVLYATWFMVLCLLIGKEAHAADLAVPKHKPELCLVAGQNGGAGQILKADKNCKSGLRWVNQ